MKDQKYYDRIVKRIEADNNYDVSKKRFISDINDGYLFYYPETGKILLSQNNQFKTIFRYKDVCWVLRPQLKQLLTQLEK